MKRQLRRGLAWAAALLVLPWVWLGICVLGEPLPRALSEVRAESLEIADRHGRVLRVVRTERGELSNPVRLERLSPSVVPALLAAEDSRFYAHPGVDPLAMIRALGQALQAGKVVSGASTLTQQLARTVAPRPRTLPGKWREMAVALRIELELDKRRIVEEYLSRVEFGPRLRGIEAASRHYFDKPARELSLAEAATLVAIPRGPTLYDPLRGTTRVKRRRDRVLERLRGLGLVEASAIDRALATPLVLAHRLPQGGVDHLTRALVQGKLGVPVAGGSRVKLSIDADLQREVEALARRAAEELGSHRASALAVIVLDNPTGEVLSYVGSPDFLSQEALGQNDGVRALRQPGSTLKPFVYAVAMQELGMTAATLLPDLPLYRGADSGDLYAPENYDRRFHGPVRLREALASSLNVPAVWTAEKVGVARVLEILRTFGFESLRESAEHYGQALALGDGEIRLDELAGAYAALARGGSWKPLRYTPSAAPADDRRVLDPRVAAVVTEVLSDREARAGTFGLNSVLALPFPVAVKTGTSKGLRDNWTVGYTREVTVAVWVGNFDGTPLVRSSGVTGAGPLFREVMLAAMRGREPGELVDRPVSVELEICALSGHVAGGDCAHRLVEHFVPGTEPRAACSMHERVRVDAFTGLRAGPNCRDAEERVFESYAADYASWAVDAGRPVAPAEYSPRCPGPALAAAVPPELVFPVQGSRFVLDPLAGDRQEIVLEARRVPASAWAEFVLDGRIIARTRAPHRLPYRLMPGQHTLRVTSGGLSSAPASFEVSLEARSAPELPSRSRLR